MKKGDIKIGHSIAGRVVKEKKCIAVEDVSKDARIESPEYAAKEGIVSMLSAPLIVRDKVIGCITIYSKTMHTYTDEEIDILSKLGIQAAIAIEYVKTLKPIRDELSQKTMTLSEAISEIDAYDRKRAIEKAEYAELIAKELNLPDITTELVKSATFLYDIGKIAIPKKILSKPSVLNKEEFEIIKTHSEISKQILDGVVLFPWKISDTVKQHHERVDGSGYPEGLTKEAIFQEALIIEVVDAFCAMISDRPYRKALSVEEAVKELQKEAGKQFSPEVVTAFLNVLKKKGMIKN
jgi:HD-GYP domain-containing protein (c-di-GMP phosphodiesterase class II)